jgi:hypothetical protein
MTKVFLFIPKTLYLIVFLLMVFLVFATRKFLGMIALIRGKKCWEEYKSNEKKFWGFRDEY